MVCYDAKNTPRTKISIPIPMRISPPRISAFPESLFPTVFPIFKPVMQIAKVTAAIIIDAASALEKL